MHRILFLFLATILFSNCGKDETILFSMPYQDSFEIPAGLNTIDNHYFVLENIPTNKTSLFNANNVTDEDIVTINPESCRLTAVFNSEYGFLFDVSVRMYTDDPLDYKEIFYRENIPENTGSQLDLIPTLVNVRDFMMEETFNVEIVLIRPRVPSPEFIDTIVKFEFAAK